MGCTIDLGPGANGCRQKGLTLFAKQVGVDGKRCDLLERDGNTRWQRLCIAPGLTSASCCVLVAGLARAMSAAVMSPVTLVKTRMEYGGPNHITYKNTGHALATIARTEGPSGLFRGLMPTVLTNAPFSALYYMIYTKLKVSLSAWQSNRSEGSGGWNSTAINFVSGVCAATAATLMTQPTDVVRTRMQLGLPGAAKRDVLGTLGHVLRSSGPNALLVGEQPRPGGMVGQPWLPQTVGLTH